MSGGAVYLDGSAFVKLALPEPESHALALRLRTHSIALSSEILEIEAARAAAQVDGAAAARAERRLEAVALIPLSPEIRRSAKTLKPPDLRLLDAIHLATALALGADLEAVLTYDRRLAAAAEAAGLPAEAPN